MPVEYNINTNNSVMSVTVSGRFDHSVNESFRKLTKEADKVTSVVIDLSRSVTIDSSALGMLLVLKDRVGGDKDAIQLQKLPDNIRKCIKISGLDQLFSVT